MNEMDSDKGPIGSVRDPDKEDVVLSLDRFTRFCLLAHYFGHKVELLQLKIKVSCLRDFAH